MERMGSCFPFIYKTLGKQVSIQTSLNVTSLTNGTGSSLKAANHSINVDESFVTCDVHNNAVTSRIVSSFSHHPPVVFTASKRKANGNKGVPPIWTTVVSTIKSMKLSKVILSTRHKD